MVSKQPLTDQALIDLLEKQRRNFTHRYHPLRAAQAIALSKANDILAAVLESLNWNYGKKKANCILTNIKNCIGYDVFVLCALATRLSSLSSSKLNNYISTVELWWDQVTHPLSLTKISERYQRGSSSKYSLENFTVDTHSGWLASSFLYLANGPVA